MRRRNLDSKQSEIQPEEGDENERGAWKKLEVVRKWKMRNRASLR